CERCGAHGHRRVLVEEGGRVGIAGTRLVWYKGCGGNRLSGGGDFAKGTSFGDDLNAEAASHPLHKLVEMLVGKGTVNDRKIIRCIQLEARACPFPISKMPRYDEDAFVFVVESIQPFVLLHDG